MKLELKKKRIDWPDSVSAEVLYGMNKLFFAIILFGFNVLLIGGYLGFSYETTKKFGFRNWLCFTICGFTFDVLFNGLGYKHWIEIMDLFEKFRYDSNFGIWTKVKKDYEAGMIV